MNINIQRLNSAIFGGMQLGNGLKSAQQKAQRQETRDNQIAFFEQQKDNLKNMKCETVEEIAKKLDIFHSYEDQITAAKVAYNNEQMMHLMDESREIGEKIAKAVEKSKPKTPEERMEELVEEAMGTDEGSGMLDEILDEVAEMQEELQETVQEELQGELQSTVQVQEQEQIQEQDQVQEQIQDQDAITEETVKVADGVETEIEDKRLLEKLYTPIDLRI